jgi:DNA-binding MarR family transcriptional regulator
MPMGKRDRKGSRKDKGRPTSHAERPWSGDGAAQGTVAGTDLAAILDGIGAQIGRQLGRGADEDGLTRARLSALSRLVLGGPCTLGTLASHEGVRPPTMTRLVHSMEIAGVVSRERHPTDGRSILLRATPAGEALLASGQAARLAPLADAIDQLGRDERRDLARSTDVIDRFLRHVSGTRRRT